METLTQTSTLNAVEYFRTKLAYETTPHDLKAEWEKGSVYILDVRDPESYKKEHISGAANIPLADIVQHLTDIPRDRTIVTYCWNTTCALATKAALRLAEEGFTVQELVGGITEWKGRKFPVEGTGTRKARASGTARKSARRRH